MRSVVKMTLLAAALAMSAPAVMAQDALKERQTMMKEIVGKNAKLGNQLAKGEVPYDGTQAANAMTAINGVPDKFVKLFPAGTDSDSVAKSEASPKIWTDMAGFVAAADKLKVASAAAAEAAKQGQAEFATAFGNVFKACKGCHDAYRVEKD